MIIRKKNRKQITGLISELKPLISDIGDATLIVPLNKRIYGNWSSVTMNN